MRIKTGTSPHTKCFSLSTSWRIACRLGKSRGQRPVMQSRIPPLVWPWAGIFLGLVLFAGASVLQASTLAAVFMSSPGAQNGTVRDYIYLGGRLIAIEETAGGAGGGPIALSISSTRLIKEEKGFRLVVNGANFRKDSVIRVNGEDCRTTFVNSKQLSTVLPGSVDGHRLEIVVPRAGDQAEDSNKAGNHWETM